MSCKTKHYPYTTLLSGKADNLYPPSKLPECPLYCVRCPYPIPVSVRKTIEGKTNTKDDKGRTLKPPSVEMKEEILPAPLRLPPTKDKPKKLLISPCPGDGDLLYKTKPRLKVLKEITVPVVPSLRCPLIRKTPYEGPKLFLNAILTAPFTQPSSAEKNS